MIPQISDAELVLMKLLWRQCCACWCPLPLKPA